ncbi:MAG: ABC transporter permease [Calditrichaeota bacterium]|nr:MAG: ABC transporter permease [Calditrichota bacterium]
MFFKLAWKNIWRNKKRTVILSSSVLFAVFLAILMRSAQLGSYRYMIDSAARQQTGYLQVQDSAYLDQRSLEYGFVPDSVLMSHLEQTPHVTVLAPRLVTYALLSSDSVTRAVAVTGIDPRREERFTRLGRWLESGAYLTREDDGALIGSGLATQLNVSVEDSLVLYGMGLYGQTAAAMIAVKGIVDMPIAVLNNRMVYISLENARFVFGAPGRVTSLAFLIDEPEALEVVKSDVNRLLPPALRVVDWKELMPEMHQSIQIDNASGIIMLAILYVVITFGVLGVIMMMTAERTREWGVLLAVGMPKKQMQIVTVLESVMITLIGAVSGVVVSIPLIYWLSLNPIHITGEMAVSYEKLGIEPVFAFTAQADIFLAQTWVVILIALLCAIYPLTYIARLRVTRALRQ